MAGLLGDRISRSEDERRHHGMDEGWHLPVSPEAVVYPHSTEEVAAIRANPPAGAESIKKGKP